MLPNALASSLRLKRSRRLDFARVAAPVESIFRPMLADRIKEVNAPAKFGGRLRPAIPRVIAVDRKQTS
jgi:hypothetical protein